MKINRTGQGFTPEDVRQTSSSPPAGDASSLPVGELRPRGSSSSTPPRRNSLTLPASSSADISARVNEVTALLDAGGMAMLQQGAQDGFKSLPLPYRSLAMQTARLVGVTTEQVPAGSAMPFPALASRLEAVTSAASELVKSTMLDLQSALRLDAQQLAPHLTLLKDAGRITAAGIAQTPVAELLANKKFVKDKLTEWEAATSALHEQLKANTQFGEKHPMTAAALEARTEAAAAYGKTMVRMAAANLPSVVFNMTIGPVISGVARFFGSGN